MNKKNAMDMINNNVGIVRHFFYRGTRNQIEEFDGKIVKCYPSIFVVELFDKTIKTFSYNDFIIGNIRIVK